MRDSVRNQVDRARLVPQGAVGDGDRQLRLRRSSCFGVFGAFTVGPWLLWIAGAAAADHHHGRGDPVQARRGQRTADGRAVCDQVEGFKTYLATAEADSSSSRRGRTSSPSYLPWAIVFELADRWAKICGDLVALGRLPDTTPYWYVGQLQHGRFNTGFLTSSLTTAATPVAVVRAAAAPASAAAARFGGGGFSGGGGGGGGGGSW